MQNCCKDDRLLMSGGNPNLSGLLLELSNIAAL